MEIIKKNQLIILFPLFVISFFSCSLINQNKFADLIIENKWTGETIVFSDVSSEILKQKYINRGWSKLNKNKNIPYFKLKKHKGVILGNYYKDHIEYLVVQLDNGKKYKWKKNHWQVNDKAIPSHLGRLTVLDSAKKMIDKFIWLNTVSTDTVFINNTGLRFNRFKKVKVIDTKVYQNGGRDWPIWLEIKSDSENSVLIRYNGNNKTEGRQNNYFVNNPLPKIWGKDIIKKIISGKIENGMNEDQVRISIGNPNVINNTSSRHSISSQWIYGNTIGEKKYLLFEYGKLVKL